MKANITPLQENISTNAERDVKLKIIVMDEENSGKSKLLFNFVDYYVNIFQECGVEGGTKFVNLEF